MSDSASTEIRHEESQDERKILSTRDFVLWLSTINKYFEYKVLKVDLDLYEFKYLIKKSPLSITLNSEGLFGLIKDNRKKFDLSRSSRRFVFHTDGPYYREPPRYVILHCVDPGQENSGIASVLQDTRPIIKQFSRQQVDVLRQIDFIYHGRKGNRTRRNLIEVAAGGSDLVSNFGGKGHLELVPSSDIDFFTWMSIASEFFKKISNSKYGFVRHRYKKFDTLVFDNHIFLHGRENPKEIVDCDRKLYRIRLDRK